MFPHCEKTSRISSVNGSICATNLFSRSKTVTFVTSVPLAPTFLAAKFLIVADADVASAVSGDETMTR